MCDEGVALRLQHSHQNKMSSVEGNGFSALDVSTEVKRQKQTNEGQWWDVGGEALNEMISGGKWGLVPTEGADTLLET